MGAIWFVLGVVVGCGLDRLAAAPSSKDAAPYRPIDIEHTIKAALERVVPLHGKGWYLTTADRAN